MSSVTSHMLHNNLTSLTGLASIEKLGQDDRCVISIKYIDAKLDRKSITVFFTGFLYNRLAVSLDTPKMCVETFQVEEESVKTKRGNSLD